jgi:hypothetical protein
MTWVMNYCHPAKQLTIEPDIDTQTGALERLRAINNTGIPWRAVFYRQMFTTLIIPIWQEPEIDPSTGLPVLDPATGRPYPLVQIGTRTEQVYLGTEEIWGTTFADGATRQNSPVAVPSGTLTVSPVLDDQGDPIKGAFSWDTMFSFEPLG